CARCQAPDSARHGPGAWEGSPPYPPVLCPACWDQVRAQDQPFAGYQLLYDLGERNWARRHLAVRRADGSLVVLNLLRAVGTEPPPKVERLRSEAKIIRSLSHPPLLACRDVGLSDRAVCVAYQYVPGVEAARVVEKHGPRAVGRAVPWACQVLEALAY